MERDYCPWCNTGFNFDDDTRADWPLRVECPNCLGEIVVVQQIDYVAERGYKLPPAIVTHPPRI